MDMSEIRTVTKVEPTDGLLQLMALLNEDQRHHDKVVAVEGKNGLFVREKGLAQGAIDPTVSFSETACGLLASSEERLLR